ncbi:hypothetical protein AcW1_010250 [Taiwanofungus camphoratus]|nr:hypothetical protein AcW1_010250 [Antrodia cinnamomea]
MCTPGPSSVCLLCSCGGHPQSRTMLYLRACEDVRTYRIDIPKASYHRPYDQPSTAPALTLLAATRAIDSESAPQLDERISNLMPRRE